MTSSSDDSQNTSATRWLPQAGLQQLIFFSIVILYIAARLWRLTAGCLWFDEIFSVHAARHSWRELFSFVAADVVHPPLFYALLKIWIAAGGESLVWLRLFPFLISVAAIVPLMLLCRALQLNAAETNLALLLLAVNGYLIKYAQDWRKASAGPRARGCRIWRSSSLCLMNPSTFVRVRSTFIRPGLASSPLCCLVCHCSFCCGAAGNTNQALWPASRCGCWFPSRCW